MKHETYKILQETLLSIPEKHFDAKYHLHKNFHHREVTCLSNKRKMTNLNYLLEEIDKMCDDSKWNNGAFIYIRPNHLISINLQEKSLMQFYLSVQEVRDYKPTSL